MFASSVLHQARSTPRTPSFIGFGVGLAGAPRNFATTIARRASDRYAAFDSGFNPDDLQAARQWRQALTQDALPQGNTTFSRSSGPGGQHVNKTETKATTVWPIYELQSFLPTLLRDRLRTSRYYTKATDSLTIQAQTQRSRTANAGANREKLFDELVALYEATVPGETQPETATKYKAIEKAFHAARIKEKKKQSSKKQFRRGGSFE
ncbi:peptidyl-tRNA hydrolase ICT1 [Sporothrix brasiliensis 5110]|uniref:Peptidyl-tRNA hydrolase ICT1 n=1 Tax=Sporothrix brasiliensis 5110 TaxID=1398154 RepID=A0A0C2FD28_9PEZI|nr:peptidyl-tRNA hydrolase ICT1 [Sporothrix brasiliensis 5110]KIH89048.1 peptidyl-tRNA hydrolase ICT1 [Sporothrix brasiliensis 5110]